MRPAAHQIPGRRGRGSRHDGRRRRRVRWRLQLQRRPAQTYFTIDGRFNPEEDIDAELTRITATVNDAAKDAGAEVSIQVTQVAPPADTPLSNKAARVLGECVTDITGSPARYELCAGCLDTRWYTQLGIPAFGFSPVASRSPTARTSTSKKPPYVVSPPSTPFAAKLFNRAPMRPRPARLGLADLIVSLVPPGWGRTPCTATQVLDEPAVGESAYSRRRIGIPGRSATPTTKSELVQFSAEYTDRVLSWPRRRAS